jgi:hypothetical protein
MAVASQRGICTRFFLLFCVALLQCHAFDLLSEVTVSKKLAITLKNTNFEAINKPLTLRYGIFHGRSALRNLSAADKRLLGLPELSKTAVAILFLLRGLGDAAHEVLLGVTLANLSAAEYAATHPGQTDWADRHALATQDDLLHSIMHRCEGCQIGEGNHTGYENAAYWVAGGPKKHALLPPHPVTTAMIQQALIHAPLCVQSGIISNRLFQRRYRIIAGGGRKRTVSVGSGSWDPFRFIYLCRDRHEASAPMVREIDLLQVIEIKLLLLYEIMLQRNEKVVEENGGPFSLLKKQ